MSATMRDMARRAPGTGSIEQRHGSWFARWREPNGTSRSKTLGRVRARHSEDGLTRREAESMLRTILLGAESLGMRSVASVTVAELCAAHLAALERDGRKPSHLRASRFHVESWIKPTLGAFDVASLDERDVRGLVDRMIRAGRSPKYIKNVRGTLHGALERALHTGLVERNVVAGVTGPRVRRATSIRFLTSTEVQRVLDAAPDPSCASRSEVAQWPVTRLLILTAVSSGLRLGELRGLRWRDLDFGAMRIRVEHSYVRGVLSTPKTERSARSVPLASVLMDALDVHHRQTVWNADTDFVLAHPHTGRPMSETRLREHFKAALKRADVRPVRIHDLRHTFATTIAASGRVPIWTLQAWMGHESITTTQIYQHYAPADLEAQILDAALGTPAVHPIGQHAATQTPENPIEQR